MTKQELWTRRAVLNLGWAGLIASAALTVEPLFKFLSSKEDRQKSPLVVYSTPLAESDGWQKAAAARVWVKRDSSGVMALVATCTHLGCEVSYHPDQSQWLCPCHGSVYDEEGSPLSGPAPRTLPRVAVEEKPDGSLWVNSAKPVAIDSRG